MKTRIGHGWVMLVLLVGSIPAGAHFQELIPSKDIVTGQGDRDLEIDIVFGHPMENASMRMAKPKRFGVLLRNKDHDLLESLRPWEVRGNRAWKTTYTIRKPGDHVFYVEPAPYWEPAESVMIVHYTKVVVNAMGMESGWDQPVGFPVEIMPLTRPYGLWTGNLFQGTVVKDGRPVSGVRVEVEYLNTGGKVKIPSDPYVTQVIRTDANGLFSYALPKSGWWGFAALVAGDTPMKNPEGEEVDVEMGALIWVYCRDLSEGKE